MKRWLFIFILLIVPYSLHAQSPLATCAANTAVGTFRECTAMESTFTSDMIFPALPAGTGGDGGITFGMEWVWDSVNHLGYLWSGEHSSEAICNGGWNGTTSVIPCADASQRFIRYDDAANQWTTVIDQVTGKPHNSYSTFTGGHPYDGVILDPSSGDFYKYWWGAGLYRFPRAGTQTWTASLGATSAFDGNTIGGGGTAWYPEANGILMAAPYNSPSPSIQFWSRGDQTWHSLGAHQFGSALTIAIYNPVLHEVLLGSGGGSATGPPNFTDVRQLWRAKYNGGDATQATSWTFTQQTLIPAGSICSGSNPFFVDSSGAVGMISVDATTGKYYVLTRDSSCNAIVKVYDSVAQTWNNVSVTIPADLANVGTGNPNSGQPGAHSMVATIPEYGVMAWIMENSPTTPPYAKVYLFRPPAAPGNPPTVPTGLRSTATTAISNEVIWGSLTPTSVGDFAACDASTAGAGGTLAGYRVYLNGNLYTSTPYCIANIVGLNSGTTYSITISAYDTDSAESAQSSPVSITTDAGLLTFSQKCAMAGVFVCNPWDSATELVYNWPSAFGGGSEWQASNYCDLALGPGGRNVPNVPSDPSFTPYANTVATYQNGICLFPQIDNTVFHSGGGSIRFPVGTHSGASAGEYYGYLHKYSNTSFGYAGVTSATPHASAVHLSDQLWIQFYQRLPSIFLNQVYYAAAYGAEWLTTSAGSTHIVVFDCVPYGVSGPPGQRDFLTVLGLTPADVNTLIGRHIWFTAGENFTPLFQQFTVAGADTDGCGMTLTVSPTPTAAGPAPGSTHYADGFLDSTTPANGWKVLGIFADPSDGSGVHSCCAPAAQTTTSYKQTGVVEQYSYGAGGGTTNYNSGSMQPQRPGCQNYDGTVFDPPPGVHFTDPTCIRWQPDVWQEFTIHIDFTGATSGCFCIHFQEWVDGQLAWDTNKYSLLWGSGGDNGNGMGSYNFSPYHTNRDPNQSITATNVWYDDAIFSPNPIPMLSSVNPISTLTISKTGPTSVAPSTSQVYIIGLGNSGSVQTGTSATVKDQLPVGMTATSVASGTGVSTVGCTNLNVAGAILTCTVALSAPLGPGSPTGTATFNLTTTVPATSGVYTNYASVDSTGGTSPGTPGPSCTGSCTSLGFNVTGGGDTISPVVTINAPSSNATIQGFLQGTATATDNVAVFGVQFQIDGVSVGAETIGNAPTLVGSVVYNLTPIKPGRHALTAVARDSSGNLGSTTINIVVKPRTNIIKKILKP